MTDTFFRRIQKTGDSLTVSIPSKLKRKKGENVKLKKTKKGFEVEWL